MSKLMPRGFIWDGKFFPNKGNGHEGNARDIIWSYQERYPNENWDWHEFNSAKTFLIMKKKAIQVASGTEPLCAIAAGMYYSKEDVNKILARYDLIKYKIYLFWDAKRLDE